MLKRIIEWSVNNRFLVGFFTLTVVGWGAWAAVRTPIDAVPDLSDIQVIVFTEFKGQAPQIVEDQVTYPLTTAMLAVPGVRVVRGYSMFGLSFVYLIFEDNVDLYWARSRVLEYLNYVSGQLPEGVRPQLGPDATGVGWAFEYVVIGEGYSQQELRSIQDWYIRYQLTSVPGVAEVASVGGFEKQYQVLLDPERLRAYGIPLKKVLSAVRMSNEDVGGRLLELGGTEFMIRGLGYVENISDIESIPLGTTNFGTPIRLADVATVQLGPEMRRGAADWNGAGETVAGIVVMRFGENALDVIDRVKAKIEEIKPGLPDGVKIVPVYDRTDLIKRAIDTLKEKLLEESIVVALVALVFLLHFRSALVAILTLPVGILMAFIPMYYLGFNANIMSLGGIAIAVGAMIAAAVPMIENLHKHMERNGQDGEPRRSHWELVLDSTREVGPALFFSLLIIIVSFLPVFALQAQEGRLFKPLAATKTFVMAASALLSVTLVPVAMGILIRGKIRSEAANPVNRIMRRLYEPVLGFALRNRFLVLVGAGAILVATAFPWKQLGSEFMPPLREGSVMFMPTTLPGISITEARRILRIQDSILTTFPEVESVFGKAGRARTATDPAPLSMMETVITLKPESEWRPGITYDSLVNEMDHAVRLPGVTNSWTMPIKARIDMLATGIRTPVGIKIFGPDLDTLERLGKVIEKAVLRVPGTRSAIADRSMGGSYIDIDIDRDAAARYGLAVGDIQRVVMTAIGGRALTQTVEGLERYTINVRYAPELRDTPEALATVLVPTPMGPQIPLGQVADIRLASGPPIVKTENALPTAWVFVDVEGRDIGSYVKEAQQVIASAVQLPAGYFLQWSGQYEYMQRANQRLRVVVPVTLALIFLLLFLHFKNVTQSAMVMASLPFALVGGVWLMWLLGYNMSIAVGVGFIALAGVSVEIGVVMLVYLDEAYHRLSVHGERVTAAALFDAIGEGAGGRVRSVIMTVTAIVGGLLPILWSSGTGAGVMKRIAAPMVGGMLSATALTLVVIPVLYSLWREWQLRRRPVDVVAHEALVVAD